MRWNRILGTIVVVGALAATEVQAQENAAGDKPQLKETTKPAHQGYGRYVAGPATVDANGVPVAIPNPMSEFEDRNRLFGVTPFPTPLVDDPRPDGSAPDGQTK
jgi:hypothetical protein